MKNVIKKYNQNILGLEKLYNKKRLIKSRKIIVQNDFDTNKYKETSSVFNKYNQNILKLEEIDESTVTFTHTEVCSILRELEKNTNFC